MRGLTFKSSTDPVSLKNFLKGKKTETLAYATTVEFDSGIYIIRHHNTAIAAIRDFGLGVTNDGFKTSVTRDRINMVLKDNWVPFSVSQKNGAQVLRNNDSGEEYKHFTAASFIMRAGSWELSDWY